jgi:hypothetical protein
LIKFGLGSTQKYKRVKIKYVGRKTRVFCGRMQPGGGNRKRTLQLQMQLGLFAQQ